jgi:3-methyladenine DNA glycosylase Tag
MGLEKFDAIYQRVCERKGSEAMVESLLSVPLSKPQLEQIPDHRFLSEFTKKVFQSGFVWRVVRQKWPHFEDMFWGFDVDKLLLMPDEMVERKATDPKIIRNLTKVRTIRENAIMIKDAANEFGSFAQFVSQWNSNDVIGLWEYLKRNGARLGGNTGPYALRFLGVDTFLLSRDVEGYFVQHKIISGSARSKRSLNAIQSAFNEWREQSGRSLTELSQLLAYSVGDNHVGIQSQ